jgi:hypothetical protein
MWRWMGRNERKELEEAVVACFKVTISTSAKKKGKAIPVTGRGGP